MYQALNPRNAARDQVLATVENAIAAHQPSLTLGLDELPTLEAGEMGSLIVALRRMRETGGSVVLHVTRPDMLQALAETGLDRVFKVVALPGSPKERAVKKRAGGVRRVARGLA
jgi:anti-anti-sigma regulatory factor